MNFFKKTTFIIAASIIVAAGTLIILSIWDLIKLPEDFMSKSIKSLVIIVLVSITINGLNRLYQKNQNKDIDNHERPKF